MAVLGAVGVIVLVVVYMVVFVLGGRGPTHEPEMTVSSSAVSAGCAKRMIESHSLWV
jgi:hypothetical protein